MEAPAIFIEVVDEVSGSDGIVEGLGVLEALVPSLVDGSTDELHDGLLGCLQGSEVGEFGHVDGLITGANDRCGGSVDGIVIEKGALGPYKEDGVFCFVFVALRDEADKIVPYVSIVWNAK